MKIKLLDLCSISMIIIQVVVGLMISKIKDLIPVHWNIYGEVDDYGISYEIWILITISLIIFLSFTWLEKHPDYCNYPHPFKNKKLAYSLLSQLLCWLKMITILIMTYLCVSTYFASLNMLYIVLLSVILVGTIAIYIAKLSKA